MSEAVEVPALPSRTKSKSASVVSGTPKVEMPMLEMPKMMPMLEMPKMEIPAAFREIAEKSVSQAKEACEKMKAAAEEATEMLEDSYANASKGVSDYGLKLIEAARENTNTAFDFASRLVAVKSLSEMVELSTSHTRKQYESVAAQTKELAAIAQRVATETTEPVRQGLGKVFKLG
jgi:phasin